jgi:hypothetical protein
MIRRYLFLLCLFFTVLCSAQTDTTQWVRAFPITNYITKLNDSVNVVQVYLPEGPVLKEKQLGLLRGVYMDKHSDTVIIGAGRCHLIKGTYYYFSINSRQSGRTPKENDMLYTVVEKPLTYNGQLLRLASHLIELQNVYEEPFYSFSNIFEGWKQEHEQRIIDSMVRDIRFTGDYFSKNEPAQDKLIETGAFKGKKIFAIMINCEPADVKNFFDYIIVRPRLYAGKKWKLSEIFATWASSGAPMVVK